MMRMYCIVLLTLTGFLFAGGCGASNGSSAPGEKAAPVVSASLLTASHVFFQDMVAKMEAESQTAGLRLRTQYAEFDLRRQLDQLETFVAQQPDAIILAPADSSGIAPGIANARAANIPVFTVDIAAEGAQVVSHVASDNVGGGKLAAEFLAKAIGGKGKVAIVDHPTVRSVQDRTAGFDEVMAAQYPEIEIVARVPSDGQRDKALRATQDLLLAHPDLNGIFAINDDSALGALAAVNAANLQDSVVIVGFDGTPEAREEIARGTALKADIVQHPDEIGARIIQVVADHLAGKEVPAEVKVPVSVLDQAAAQAERDQ